MIWTLALVSTGVSSIVLAGSKYNIRRNLGWVIYTLNEILWFLYALHTSDTPLAIMACVWFAAGVVNIIRTARAERPSMLPRKTVEAFR